MTTEPPTQRRRNELEMDLMSAAFSRLRVLLGSSLLLTIASCSGDSSTGPDGGCDPRTGNCGVVGTIRGTVAIEGRGEPGVTVLLSGAASQSGSTAANGSYQFANLQQGGYTVTISDYPADCNFEIAARNASISTNGQVVTLDFGGTYIRTSAIEGHVWLEGEPMAGVEISAAGPEEQSDTTDAAGAYSLSAIRAGQYTVTAGGFDPNLYWFESTSQSV
jgi:hypothetical protein